MPRERFCGEDRKAELPAIPVHLLDVELAHELDDRGAHALAWNQDRKARRIGYDEASGHQRAPAIELGLRLRDGNVLDVPGLVAEEERRAEISVSGARRLKRRVKAAEVRELRKLRGDGAN